VGGALRRTRYDPGHDLPLEPEAPELLQAKEEGEREFALQPGRFIRLLRELPEPLVLPLSRPPEKPQKPVSRQELTIQGKGRILGCLSNLSDYG